MTDQRHDSWESRVESRLRSLPEVEPPADLADRIMTAVLATESTTVEQPTGIKRVPGRWLAAAILLLSVGASWVVRSSHAWAGQLARIGHIMAEGTTMMIDLWVSVLSGVSVMFAKAVVVISAFTSIGRTVAAAAWGEVGTPIVVALILTVGLQLLLLSVAGRRRGVS